MKLTPHPSSWVVPGLMLCLAAPVPAQAQQPSASRVSAEAANSAAGATPPNYCLAANDLVYIKVFEEDDLNSTLRITEDGFIIFPLVGTVKIGGLSVQDNALDVGQPNACSFEFGLAV